MRFKVYREGLGDDAIETERKTVQIETASGPLSYSVGPRLPGHAVIEYIIHHGGNDDLADAEEFMTTYVIVAIDEEALSLKPPHHEDGEHFWLYRARGRIEWTATEEVR